jgi:hypothetical protein
MFAAFPKVQAASGVVLEAKRAAWCDSALVEIVIASKARQSRLSAAPAMTGFVRPTRRRSAKAFQPNRPRYRFVQNTVHIYELVERPRSPTPFGITFLVALLEPCALRYSQVSGSGIGKLCHQSLIESVEFSITSRKLGP